MPIRASTIFTVSPFQAHQELRSFARANLPQPYRIPAPHCQWQHFNSALTINQLIPMSGLELSVIVDCVKTIEYD